MRVNKDILTEIAAKEEESGKTLMENQLFADWVMKFRKKFIVDKFLLPLYSQEGVYSVCMYRINRFGYYVMNSDMQGTTIQKITNTHIHNEELWFWEYLISGQLIDDNSEDSVKRNKQENIAGQAVWKEVWSILSELDLADERGGGLMFGENDLTLLNSLARVPSDTTSIKDTEVDINTEQLSWIDRYFDYKNLSRTDSTIEIRPAWFHVIKYAFFNTPISLPVVYCKYSLDGQIVDIRFLHDDLSDEARTVIGKVLLGMPKMFHKAKDQLFQEVKQIRWFLLNRIGQHDTGPQTYGQISSRELKPRTTVYESIKQFEKELKQGIDANLLGLILRTGMSIGLDVNFTYNALVAQGYLSERTREIDGFDNIDKLL